MDQEPNDRRGRLALVAAVALVLGFGASRSGAAADSSAASLNVELPRAASDHIYAAPGSAGRPLVVIDAGHGGTDPGAIGVSREISEKQLTLALAHELRDVLIERGRVRVAMTRDDDRYLSLDDRAAVARRLDAGLFVSLHMDSAPNPLARGASVYSLSDVASDAEAARFAAKLNRDAKLDGDAQGSVKAMLSDLAMRDQMGASAALRHAWSTDPPDGSNFARNRINSLLFMCFGARARRRCCSRRATSATPTMNCSCVIPNIVKGSCSRSPRRSRRMSPRDQGTNPNFQTRDETARCGRE